MKKDMIEMFCCLLNSINSESEHAENMLMLTKKSIHQAQKLFTQLHALSSPSVESCPLSEIPGYLPELQGCLAAKIDDCLIVWKENREALCALASGVVCRCTDAEAAYRAGPAHLPAEPDPCRPSAETLVETVLDARNTFSQALHILLLEEEDVSSDPEQEVPNLLLDMDEIQSLLDSLKERLQVCCLAEEATEGCSTPR